MRSGNDGARQWQVVNVRERMNEDAVAPLIAAGLTPIHPDPERRIERANEVAVEYGCSRKLDIWGVEHDDGRIVGIIGVEDVGSREIIVRDLGVSTETRRQGAGRALIDFVRVKLQPDVLLGYTWPEALDFYEHCGFEVRVDGSLPSGDPRYAFQWKASRRGEVA